MVLSRVRPHDGKVVGRRSLVKNTDLVRQKPLVDARYLLLRGLKTRNERRRQGTASLCPGPSAAADGVHLHRPAFSSLPQLTATQK